MLEEIIRTSVVNREREVGPETEAEAMEGTIPLPGKGVEGEVLPEEMEVGQQAVQQQQPQTQDGGGMRVQKRQTNQIRCGEGLFRRHGSSSIILPRLYHHKNGRR